MAVLTQWSAVVRIYLGGTLGTSWKHCGQPCRGALAGLAKLLLTLGPMKSSTRPAAWPLLTLQVPMLLPSPREDVISGSHRAKGSVSQAWDGHGLSPQHSAPRLSSATAALFSFLHVTGCLIIKHTRSRISCGPNTGLESSSQGSMSGQQGKRHSGEGAGQEGA